MRALCLALLLAAGFTSAALAAPAKDEVTAKAKAHFAKGKSFYKQARYREAIAEFEAAYKLKPHGVIFFNIAQSHEKLGDIPAALRSFHQYLREVPGAEDRETVQAAMRNLEKRLAEKGLQQILVYSQPPGGSVLIDGKRRGATPFSAELPLGKHTVAVEVEGYRLTEREVTLTADTSLALDFTLEKKTEAVPLLAVPEPEPEPLKKPELTPPVEPPVPAVASPPPPPMPEPTKGRLWTYVAAGASGAALAAGAYFGASAQSASDALMSEENKQRSRDEATRLKQTALSSARTANVLYGVAGAAGATAVALFFIEGRF
ncbi:MAG: PEGA domain-containing protein [Myxococcales bacterium]|nr:PEGA domain-containing protein [Myxococcales bacterium]